MTRNMLKTRICGRRARLSGAVIFVLFTAILPSCDILRESPFEVRAWMPGDGFHERVEAVTVTFSREGNRASVERAFSLKQDGAAVSGAFSWNGATLVFTPPSPLPQNSLYELVIASDACDTAGISFDRTFSARFTTRPSQYRPLILSISPHDGGTLPGAIDPVSISFSCPVPASSCADSISLSPSAQGSWRVEGESLCIFTPLSPWKPGALYTITVESSFKNTIGMELGKSETSRFTAGTDTEAPRLVGVYAVHPSYANRADAMNATEEYTNWEAADSRLRLVFSEPVDTDSAYSRVTVEPSTALVAETKIRYAQTVEFSFAERLAFESRFLFRIGAGIWDAAGNASSEAAVYRVAASGLRSKPPILRGIRIPLAPAASDQKATLYNIALDQFAYLTFDNESASAPYGKEIPFWVELYFETASDSDGSCASIDTLSLMDAFSVTASNSPLRFSPRSVTSGSGISRAAETGWETFTRVEVGGILKNDTNMGVVVFEIAEGLRDSFGNATSEPMKLVLLK